MYVCMYVLLLLSYWEKVTVVMNVCRRSEMQREAEEDLLKGNLIIGFMKVMLSYTHTVNPNFMMLPSVYSL